jgi:hypothetical protein
LYAKLAVFASPTADCRGSTPKAGAFHLTNYDRFDPYYHPEHIVPAVSATLQNRPSGSRGNPQQAKNPIRRPFASGFGQKKVHLLPAGYKGVFSGVI